MMRTLSLSRLSPTVFLFSLLLLIAFWTPLAAQDGSSEEPNDRPSLATHLTPGAAVQASLSPEEDVDWFVIDAPEAGELAFTVDAIDPTLGLALRVWNGDLVPITSWFVAEEGEETLEGYADLVEGGRYFFEIYSDNQTASRRPFVLEVTLTPAADTGEPNNRLGDATWIGDAASVQANILPGGDYDWYWLYADDAGELIIEIDDIDETMTMSARVWSVDRELTLGWQTASAPGEALTAVADLPAAGEYYIEVAAEEGERSADPYTLIWDFTPTGDQHEPNNRFSNATWLDFGASYTATLFPASDNDLYALHASDQGELRVAITGIPEELTIVVRLRDNDQGAFSSWVYPESPSAATTAIFDLPKGGRYYLEVVDDNHDARSLSPYRIAIDLTLTEDAWEPNDSLRHAAALNFGEVVSATILPASDSDWFRVELPNGGELHAAAGGTPAGLDVSMRLWNADGQAVIEWNEPSEEDGVTTIFYEAPEPGRYYIQVAGSDGARSVQPYWLVASAAPIDTEVLFEQAEIWRENAAQTQGSGQAIGAITEQVTEVVEEVIEEAIEETTDETPAATQGGSTGIAAGGGDVAAGAADDAGTAVAEDTVAEEIDLTAITIDLPDGWVREEGDAIVVRPEGDEGTTLGAPLLRILPAGAAESDVLSILEGEIAALVILDAPEEVTIGDATAVIFALQEEVDGVLLNRGYVLLHTPDGGAWQIILESSAETWDDSLPTLEAMLESIVFGAP